MTHTKSAATKGRVAIRASIKSLREKIEACRSSLREVALGKAVKTATEALRNASMEIPSSTPEEVRAFSSLLVEEAGADVKPSFSDLARTLLADRVLPQITKTIRTWRTQDLTESTKVTTGKLIELYASDPLHSTLKLDQQRRTVRTFLELCLTKDEARDTFKVKHLIGRALLETGNHDLLVDHRIVDVLPQIHVKLSRSLELSSEARGFPIEGEYNALDFANQVLRITPDQRALLSTFLFLVALKRPALIARNIPHHPVAGNS